MRFKIKNNTVFGILFITLPSIVLLLVILEIVSRLLFFGTQLPKGYFENDLLLWKFNKNNGETGVATFGKFSQQKGRWRINNHGWNSPIDYVFQKKPNTTRIAIIGDSYIEAFQVDINKSYPYVLMDKLGNNYEVYSFGVSGSALSHYLHVARYVEEYYKPDLYIINLVHNDFDESIHGVRFSPQKCILMTLKILEGYKIEEISPTPPKERAYKKMPLSFVLKKSSLIRYLYGNLKINELFRNKYKVKNLEMNIDTSIIRNQKKDIEIVTKYILERFSDEFDEKRVIFIQDGPRQMIYENKIENSLAVELNTLVSRICNELNMEYIDLTPMMLSDYCKNGIRYETDYDGHWNVYGHAFIADVLYQYLVSKE